MTGAVLAVRATLQQGAASLLGGLIGAAPAGEEIDVAILLREAFVWDATPGPHTLTVRATDATGAVQTEQEAPPAPDGATGWHRVQVTVT